MNTDFHRYKFLNQIMNTAYSSIDLAPINTAEHYQLAAHLGFNALKGDVRITADDHLVMCHDKGITLDNDGRIGKFDNIDHLRFIDLNYDYILGLEYSEMREQLGHYARVCSFDTFVRICKEQGKIAYITLRDQKIPQLAQQVMMTLRKYHMESWCVINSFTLETLQEIRKYSDIIPLSQVQKGWSLLTKEAVDNLLPLGNVMITLFHYPAADPEALWEGSAEAIAYAQDAGIPIHMAQVGAYSDYCHLVRKGIQGFHLYRPIFPYTRKDFHFTVTVEAGSVSFGNILLSDQYAADISQTNGTVSIRNIRCPGSGYGYDDGLPALWMNTLPFSLDVQPPCPIRYENGAFYLETGEKDCVYTVHVNI